MYNVTETVFNNVSSYFTTSTLALCDLELEDADLYSCSASNNVSGGLVSANSVFFLTVQGNALVT